MQGNLNEPSKGISKTVNLSVKTSMREFDDVLFDDNIVAELLKPP